MRIFFRKNAFDLIFELHFNFFSISSFFFKKIFKLKKRNGSLLMFNPVDRGAGQYPVDRGAGQNPVDRGAGQAFLDLKLDVSKT